MRAHTSSYVHPSPLSPTRALAHSETGHTRASTWNGTAGHVVPRSFLSCAARVSYQDGLTSTALRVVVGEGEGKEFLAEQKKKNAPQLS